MTTRLPLLVLGIVSTSVGLANCGRPAGPGITDGIACTAVFVYGLTVIATDNLGHEEARGIVGIAREGTYADTLHGFADSTGHVASLYGVGERPGTYTVTLEKPGYKTWTQTGVRITSDVCHVRTVTLHAHLIPQS